MSEEPAPYTIANISTSNAAPIKILRAVHSASDEAILTRIQQLRNARAEFAVINLQTGEIGAVLAMEQTRR